MNQFPPSGKKLLSPDYHHAREKKNGEKRVRNSLLKDRKIKGEKTLQHTAIVRKASKGTLGLYLTYLLSSGGRKKGVKKPSDEKYTVKPFPQMKL